MNILVLVKLYFHRNKSGGERYLHIFLKMLNDYLKDSKITVLVPEMPQIRKFDFEGITIFETNEKLKKAMGYIQTADIVITQLDFANKVIDACLEQDKRVIAIYHGAWKGYKPLVYNNNPLFTKIMNSVNVLNALTDELKNIQNYHIINPMCDFPKYFSEKDDEVWRRDYITLINPSDNKGGDIVVELAKRNKKRKFLIVEGGYYYFAQNEFLKEFRKLPNCHIMKNTNNMIEDVYKKSKIVLMPSQYESWGMVASEASSMGIPVIYATTGIGLQENMGKLSLGCGRDVKEFEKLIIALDNPATYHLWSQLHLDIAEDNYNKNMNQINKFFNEYFK